MSQKNLDVTGEWTSTNGFVDIVVGEKCWIRSDVRTVGSGLVNMTVTSDLYFVGTRSISSASSMSMKSLSVTSSKATLTSVGDATFEGPWSASSGNLSFSVTSGSITFVDDIKTLTSGSISVLSSGGIVLHDDMEFDSSGSLMMSGSSVSSGNVTFKSALDMTLTGPWTASSGKIDLQSSGSGITLNSDVSTLQSGNLSITSLTSLKLGPQVNLIVGGSFSLTTAEIVSDQIVANLES